MEGNFPQGHQLSSLALSFGCATAGLVSFLCGAPSVWGCSPSPIPVAPSPAPCCGLVCFLSSCPPAQQTCSSVSISLLPGAMHQTTASSLLLPRGSHQLPRWSLLALHSSHGLLSLSEPGRCSSPGGNTPGSFCDGCLLEAIARGWTPSMGIGLGQGFLTSLHIWGCIVLCGKGLSCAL